MIRRMIRRMFRLLLFGGLALRFAHRRVRRAFRRSFLWLPVLLAVLALFSPAAAMAGGETAVGAVGSAQSVSAGCMSGEGSRIDAEMMERIVRSVQEMNKRQEAAARRMGRPAGRSGSARFVTPRGGGAGRGAGAAVPAARAIAMRRKCRRDREKTAVSK